MTNVQIKKMKTKQEKKTKNKQKNNQKWFKKNQKIKEWKKSVLRSK